MKNAMLALIVFVFSAQAYANDFYTVTFGAHNVNCDTCGAIDTGFATMIEYGTSRTHETFTFSVDAQANVNRGSIYSTYAYNFGGNYYAGVVGAEYNLFETAVNLNGYVWLNEKDSKFDPYVKVGAGYSFVSVETAYGDISGNGPVFNVSPGMKIEISKKVDIDIHYRRMMRGSNLEGASSDTFMIGISKKF